MRHVCMLLAAILWARWTAPAAAQSVDTGVLGTVLDASGAVIPGSDITVTSAATGVVQTVVTGPTGAFEVRYLAPGDYVVQASLSGFRTERTTITLRVGQLARLNFVLQVGNIGEVVDVRRRGCCSRPRAASPATSSTAETLVNLPLSGRNFTTLGNLTAGVVASATQFRASGARGMYQQVSFDGVSALNNRGNNLFMYPSVDAVEEFKVQATNYTAEYGGHAGANVQLQLKSGSNDLHGSVFEYVRNDAMDARNFFAPAPSPKPQLDRHQFGGVIGGPLRRGPHLLHGLVRGRARDPRERGADQRADRGDAARRLLRRRRRGHPRSADRAAVPRQHHPEQPPRSAGGLDGQSSISRCPIRPASNNFRGLTRGRGHAEPVHHPHRSRPERSAEDLRPLPLSGPRQPDDADQPRLPGAARLQQPQRGGAARDDVELDRSSTRCASATCAAT